MNPERLLKLLSTFDAQTENVENSDKTCSHEGKKKKKEKIFSDPFPMFEKRVAVV